ncbi:OxaA precursor [Salipaludibacillus neizhouensis]|uniref:Membrane protein insertase YidC n=1 Tax=Salipaludibacillus neizhouensis TaxID=885475 RepID=A0A3A9KBL0_9BACI|nr:membrane protein insertase YidC [Salipaludibacillus neizhouensis]RKL68160.1 OxaA precursor [Salipaludibacillus neizhouensis]
MIFSTKQSHFPSILPLLVVGILLLTLSGCGVNTEPINSDTPGIFNKIVVYPFSFLLHFFATIFQGSYGLSIILMTVLLRTALMPLMLKQYKNKIFMKDKMAIIHPEMTELKDRYKEKQSKEDKQEMQKEIIKLYEKHQFNPMASFGCLPVLIQLPFLIGFYYAIIRTPEIAGSSFLWFNLGERDAILPLIAAAIYSVQFQFSRKEMKDSKLVGQGGEMQQQMKIIGYILPIMMGVFSFAVAAALPLYWSIGGIFLIFQSQLARYLYKPKPSVPVIDQEVSSDTVEENK